MIDLSSDTVTQPTEGMRRVMAEAEVGDDVQGRDPTVRALEERVAGLLGCEDAIFVPSGTMANQIALWVHCQAGESVVVEEDSHCMLFEGGAAAALARVQFQVIPFAEDLSAAAIARALAPRDLIHCSVPSLFVLENTHNVGCGRARNKSEVARVVGAVASAGGGRIRLHCDGARIWNAAVAAGSTEASLVEGFDTVACCFSKGLGAPVGSCLAGKRPLIERGRKVRKILGGAMRQSGVIAAAALYGLDNHRSRLGEDHVNATWLREALGNVPGVELREVPKPTNMVYFRPRLQEDPGHWVARCEQAGLRFYHMGHGWMRWVTHLNVDRAQCEQAIVILRRTLGER